TLRRRGPAVGAPGRLRLERQRPPRPPLRRRGAGPARGLGDAEAPVPVEPTHGRLLFAAGAADHGSALRIVDHNQPFWRARRKASMRLPAPSLPMASLR